MHVYSKMIFHNSFEFSKSQHGRNQQRIVDQGCRGLWTSRQHSHLSGHCVSMIKIHLFSRFKLVNLSITVLCSFIEYGSIFFFCWNSNHTKSCIPCNLHPPCVNDSRKSCYVLFLMSNVAYWVCLFLAELWLVLEWKMRTRNIHGWRMPNL